MFFLFRCLFWLGLVFSHIAALEGTDAGALVRQSALAAGRQATEAAGRKCASAPETCLALAAQAARSSSGASRDTLSSGDRIPAWRLRPSSQ